MPCPDNYDLFLAKEAREDAWLRSRPICDKCGDPIQENHCYNIYGEIICQRCLERHFREEID